MDTNEARVMLMAIPGQESNWDARAQHGGPALSYYQFEKIGVDGVLEAVPDWSRAVLAANDIPVAEAHAAIQYHDPVATAFARLLLWSDPAPLPFVGDQAGAWDYYLRCWRPGKPDETRWPHCYQTAMEIILSPVRFPSGQALYYATA